MDEIRSRLNELPATASLWRPSDGQSRENWMACHGQPSDVCRRTRNKLNALKKLIAANTPHQKDTDHDSHLPKPSNAVPTSLSSVMCFISAYSGAV